jgi:hypothetical protein
MTDPIAQARQLPIKARRSVTVPDQMPFPRASSATPTVPRASPAITKPEGTRRSRTDVSSTSQSGIAVMKNAAWPDETRCSAHASTP